MPAHESCRREQHDGRACLPLLARTDYSNYGGSPILGFENLFIKAHGRSNATAIRDAVKVAAEAVRDDVPGEIARQIRAIATGPAA